jgi:hypothetical protein
VCLLREKLRRKLVVGDQAKPILPEGLHRELRTTRQVLLRSHVDTSRQDQVRKREIVTNDVRTNASSGRIAVFRTPNAGRESLCQRPQEKIRGGVGGSALANPARLSAPAVCKVRGTSSACLPVANLAIAWCAFHLTPPRHIARRRHLFYAFRHDPDKKWRIDRRRAGGLVFYDVPFYVPELRGCRGVCCES